ncbi:MAG: TetR/AcrR family transcriptional regulator [Peptococcaceae bacterium]|nr:TetR/AcrR family transcriptional regulator [Peptococcaceae bacterium]MBO5301557.1 TetR/AcrR family transcriptional regulator [Peptococcaceae bacterium]MBP3342384.1 TetR/AcrR family transcriptional regulator [Peptococcaceae bacterium]MBQ3119478.1 TetR/AcrR family transcriptional regulator [Peptococcaceae bacterium]MBQ6853786.1 TetR/AcrR family transcriptional regulator [Peptococcaceae bacterium]
MPAQKSYRNAVRSKTMIRQAFLELLQEKPYEKITVTDIAQRADLNRSTFYAHYPDVQGLIEEIEEEIINRSMQLLSEVTCQNIFQDPKIFLQILVQPVEENKKLYQLLVQSDYAGRQLYRINEAFASYVLNSPEIPENLRSSKYFAVRINFFIGGIINTYCQWLTGELDCSLDDIAEDIARTIQISAFDMNL